ncbi:MAG TPA: 2OG-Fe(II) oxygenase [Alphaproteobacteria bacterium]|nr:2OG-Fe(II) oxygenase [Alphaproteobacteria bacterium]
MTLLDLDRLDATPLSKEPYEFVMVPNFVRPEAIGPIRDAYPRIDQPGSFPVSKVTFGKGFANLLKALEGPDFRHAIEGKFGVDLSGRPTMVTVRGNCGPRDGGIHTDSRSKIVTVLLYLNEPWEAQGGRLRLLRSSTDLEDYALEVPPEAGLLLAFRRSDRSFHGHKPYIGPRRVVQLNWVANSGHVLWDLMRHRLSAWIKRAA